MAIEFNCTNCGKLLQTPDGTGGQQAQCPECNTMMPIPSSQAPPNSPFANPTEPVGGGTPQVNTGTQYPPNQNSAYGAGPGYHNPYQPSQTGGSVVGGYPVGGQPYQPDAKSKVLGPAIGMIVGASLSLLYPLVWFIVSLFAVIVGMAEGEEDVTIVFAIIAFVLFLIIIANIVVICGAISMMRLRKRSLAQTACVLGVIPLLVSVCVPVALPFAIWGLVVLADPYVKRAFTS